MRRREHFEKSPPQAPKRIFEKEPAAGAEEKI